MIVATAAANEAEKKAAAAKALEAHAAEVVKEAEKAHRVVHHRVVVEKSNRTRKHKRHKHIVEEIEYVDAKPSRSGS